MQRTGGPYGTNSVATASADCRICRFGSDRTWQITSSVVGKFRRLQCLVLRSVLSDFINLRSAECVYSYYGLRVCSQTNKCLGGNIFVVANAWILLRPVAQLYGHVRTDWKQCFVMDCSLSHPAGHKQFTCSHSVLRNTRLNVQCVFLLAFLCTISRNLTWALFSSVGPWGSCRLPDPLTVFCDMFATV